MRFLNLTNFKPAFSIKISKKFKRFFRLLAIGSGFLAVLSISFFSLFRIFEGITYDSISDLNRDFAIQMDSLTEMINSSIINYGMQLFYSDTVKTLMGPTSFSNTERVYMTRSLNTSLSSTDFAEAVLVHNGYTGQVYSTDPSFPNQTMDHLRSAPIRKLLLNRTNEQRFKPIYCQEDGPSKKEYYTFLFYEVYPDKAPKPSTLVLTVKSDWYKKALLAANPSSDLIVIDKDGSVLVWANDSLKSKYQKYYSLITDEKSSGYFLNNKEKEICMYYESRTTGHTYMKISSVSKLLPRLLYFRKIVIYLLAGLTSVFGVLLTVLLVFALIPMLHMKEAITTIDKLQTGDSKKVPPLPVIPRKDQLNAIVSRSERASLEQVFYDMLALKLEPSPERLFKEEKGQFGLLLIHAQHRKDIYELVEQKHPEILVTKSSHVYACIGLYSSDEDYSFVWQLLSSKLSCRCFISQLFDQFSLLNEHYGNLNELRKLSLVLPADSLAIHEQTLWEKSQTNTITTKDFTDLTVRLKSGSLEASRAKWKEILEVIMNYRYEEFQYILYRAEDTICKILLESSPELLENGQRLLPESLEQIQEIGEINKAFDRAFAAICANYSEKKAERYSGLALQIQTLIQNTYHDSSLSSQSIADRFHMNNAYLGRLFKSAYGHSINDYINTCRIHEGMKLLRNTELPVEEIAQTVGFTNIKYFYVLFKKFSGTTPSRFRTDTTNKKSD